jgi:hypothetical protein
VNLCHFFTFCHPKNQLEKYTPPYGTARGDPILMEGTVILKVSYKKKKKKKKKLLGISKPGRITAWTSGVSAAAAGL